MGRTYIRIACPKCNYSYSKSIYGYVEDPIGIPLTRCPRCNNILRDNKHKEWIQMSPIKKYFSIAPRGNILAIFLAFIPMLFLVWSDIDFGDGVFWGGLAVSWLISDYIVMSIRVNCKNCLDRIVSSISRTNNESYAELLSQFGEIYGYSIPKVLLFTKANKASIEYAVKNRKAKKIVIPTFSSSINDC